MWAGSRMAERERAHSWREELDDYLRAFGSAFLFGVPLLYTLEMWDLGASLQAPRLLTLLVLAFGLNTVLSYFGGIHQGHTLRASLEGALDALAVGVLAALAVLLILNRIHLDDPLTAVVGRVAVQSVPLSLGASIANALFSQRSGNDPEAGEQEQKPSAWRVTFNDVGATMAGGLFVGFSIAPTDEVWLIASELRLGHQLALIAFSLLITYLIVFESAFSARRVKSDNEVLFQQPFTETVMAYATSLLLSGIILVLLQQLSLADPFAHSLNKVLVLGLPVTIGGAAGRLVL